MLWTNLEHIQSLCAWCIERILLNTSSSSGFLTGQKVLENTFKIAINIKLVKKITAETHEDYYKMNWWGNNSWNDMALMIQASTLSIAQFQC